MFVARFHAEFDPHFLSHALRRRESCTSNIKMHRKPTQKKPKPIITHRMQIFLFHHCRAKCMHLGHSSVRCASKDVNHTGFVSRCVLLGYTVQ